MVQIVILLSQYLRMSHSKTAKMTSNALKKRHPEVYSSFFASHDLIISVPEILNRGYWACWRFDPKVRLQQKLPTRIYLWVSPSAKPWVHFQEFVSYNFHEDCFEKERFEEVYQGKVGARIKSVFQERLDKLEMYDGIVISVLGEFRRWSGSWYTTSLCLLYAMFIHILKSDIDINHLQKTELLKIRELSLKIDAAIYYPNTKNHEWWFSPYVSMIDSDFPVAYNWPSLFQNNKFLIDGRSLQNNSIDLKELVWDAELWYLWFEYAVIDGGGLYFSDHIRKKYESLFVYNEKPFLKTLFKELTNEAMHKSFVEVQEYHCQKSLYILMWYLHDQTESNLNKMLWAFRNLWSIYQTKVSGKDFQATIISKFKEKAGAYSQIWVLPINCSDGRGRMFCIAKSWVLKKFLPKVLDEVNALVGTDTRIVYSTWRDGTSHQWAKVDQFLSNKQYSQYIKKGTVVYSDMHGNKRIMTMSEVMALTQHWFLLDGVSKKIRYNGKKLTSKDLVSQSTTVDVLLMLFKHLNKDISNKKLQRSCYARNKNEMLSKVVLPFKKYVKNKTNMVLPLDCKWGLYDYMIRLWESAIPFHCVSKVGEGMSLSEEE